MTAPVQSVLLTERTPVLQVKAKLADLAMVPIPVDVVFDGAETGVVTAVVKACREDSESRSGLEPSVINGQGSGIIPFRNPNAESDVKVALTSRVPAAAVEHIARRRQIRANLDTDDEATDTEGPAGAEYARVKVFVSTGLYHSDHDVPLHSLLYTLERAGACYISTGSCSGADSGLLKQESPVLPHYLTARSAGRY